MEKATIGAGLYIGRFKTEHEEVEDVELTWNEYKGFVGASFAAPGTGQRPIALYGGIYLNNLSGEREVAGREAEFEEENLFGIFGGAGIATPQGWRIGLEARLLAETSFSISARIPLM